MSWMLDTNACIRYLNGRSPKLKTRLDAADPGEICVSSVVKAELYFGAAQSHNPATALARQQFFLSRFQSLPFDDAAAEKYGGIRAELTQRGQLIGPNDLLIAAICLARDVTLVTHYVAEFSRVQGLRIEDWES
jgi:tRNA(fMet)-specific endonuclease VapC